MNSGAAYISPNVAAFLAMLRASEGTADAANPYAVCYGKTFVIADFSDHPAVLGNWKGESLANLGPAYVGEVSTAAGAYQIIKPTWISLKARLNLPDFSPASQDAAAIELIRENNALDLITAGQLATAILRCRAIWASLPGGAAGQPHQTFAQLMTAYSGAGGSFA